MAEAGDRADPFAPRIIAPTPERGVPGTPAPVTIASEAIASEAVASEAVASEAIASEAVASEQSKAEPAALAMARALALAVGAGDTRAAARACRLVDEGWPGHAELLAAIYARAAASWTIGVTGSPGVGKSTLTSRLVQHFRARQWRVAVVAVDPTSPFSGGAVLGDRIRMQAHWDDADVFVRSVATRGAHGGLSRTTADVARVLGAWGARVVLIETVGVGQDELDVIRVADTTLVIQAPGAGDDIQAAKAGLLECADVFAVNKADLPGAEGVAENLRGMLALGHVTASASGVRGGHSSMAMAAAMERDQPRAADGGEAAKTLDAGWTVPVSMCVATRDDGIAELVEQLLLHQQWLNDTPRGRERRRERLHQELLGRLREGLSARLLQRHAAEVARAAERVAAGELDPYAATLALLERWS
jgi:GTPase